MHAASAGKLLGADGAVYSGAIVIATCAPVTVTNTVTETEVLSVVIPAGMLGTSGICEIIGLLGFVNTTGSARTYRRRLKVNGTTVADATSISLANGNDRLAQFKVQFLNSGATNVNYASGYYDVGGGTAATGIGQPTGTMIVHDPHSCVQAGLAIDTTAAVTISMTIELSTNSTSLSFYMRGAKAVLYP